MIQTTLDPRLRGEIEAVGIPIINLGAFLLYLKFFASRLNLSPFSTRLQLMILASLPAFLKRWSSTPRSRRPNCACWMSRRILNPSAPRKPDSCENCIIGHSATILSIW